MKSSSSKFSPKLWEEIKETERAEKRLLQEKFCYNYSLPLFALDKCPDCGTYLYDYYNVTECANTHLTSCCKCNYSLVE